MKHWIVWLNSPASNETLDSVAYIGARLKCRVVLALTVALARQDAHLHSPPWISFLANRLTSPDQRQCPQRETLDFADKSKAVTNSMATAKYALW